MLVDQGRAERALEVSESSRGRVLGERNSLAPPARVSAAALQQVAARSRSVLLSYWLGASRSYVWVVTANRRAHGVPAAGGRDRIAGAPVSGDDRQHHGRSAGLVRRPRATAVPDAGRTGAALDPAGLARGHRPRWRLHAINFETLPVPGPTRHYLIEDVEIQTAPVAVAAVGRAGGAAPRADAAVDRRSRAARAGVPGAEVRSRRDRRASRSTSPPRA